GQLGLAMSSMAAALGGGASWDGAGITAPGFSIQGTTYANVGDALGAIDNWMSSHANSVQYDDPSHETLTLDGADGTELKNVADGTEAGDAVNKEQMDDGDADTLATANDYTDGREDAIREDMDAGDAATLDAANDHADAGDAATLASANEYSDAGDAATLASAQGYADAGDAATLASANAYSDAGDAATLASAQSYADAGDAATLSSATAYTDARFAAWNDTFDQFRDEMELRFARTDERIDRMGAMSGAMSAAAINTAGLPGRNRVGLGVGVQGGHGALAIGYQRLVSPRASISLGGAFSGDENSVSAGAGFSW
ncbi:MAG TPA: YadA-like family protein, partial [Luteimonas sp.]|nr:YadA-like family protein [Luteimonas sp.]